MIDPTLGFAPCPAGPQTASQLATQLATPLHIQRLMAEPFVSKLFPCSTKVLRTEPLRAMVIGAFVRGLSMGGCEKRALLGVPGTG